jgi:hypothetical protein
LVSFFPPLYKGEILYSGIARYHQLATNRSYKKTSLELIEKEAFVSFDFPTNIKTLCNNISKYVTFEPLDIVLKHTLYPAFLPFDLYSKRKNLLEQINEIKENSILLPFRSNLKVKNRFIRRMKFCPACIKEDLVVVGEPYWHVIHQVDGIHYCPLHEIKLSDECPSCRKIFTPESTNYILLDASCSCGQNLSDLNGHFQRNNFISDWEIRISKELQYTIDNFYRINSVENWRATYRNKVRDKGYITSDDIINQGKLFDEFRSFYGDLLLFKLHSSISRYRSWLHLLLTSTSRSEHPIRHILLICFLYGSVAEFFQQSLPCNIESEISIRATEDQQKMLRKSVRGRNRRSFRS